MKSVTDTSAVADLASATKPVVIKFEAKWCQPCKAMTPIMLDVEKEFGGKVDFWVANVEHCILLAQRHRVTQIPALVILENGVATAVKTGAATKAEIQQWLKTAIPSLKT